MFCISDIVCRLAKTQSRIVATKITNYHIFFS